MRVRRLRILSVSLGILLLGYTVAGLMRNRVLLVELSDMDGVVVDVRSNSDGAATPVIRFATETGAVVDWVNRTSVGPATYIVGDHVPVLYNPDAPDRTTIGRTRNIIGLLVLTGAAGAALITIGAGAIHPMSRRRRYRG